MNCVVIVKSFSTVLGKIPFFPFLPSKVKVLPESVAPIKKIVAGRPAIKSDTIGCIYYE